MARIIGFASFQTISRLSQVVQLLLKKTQNKLFFITFNALKAWTVLVHFLNLFYIFFENIYIVSLFAVLNHL